MARQMRRSLAAMELFPSSRGPSGLEHQVRKMATDSSTAVATTVKAEVSAAKHLTGSSIKGTLGKRFYKNALVKSVAAQQQNQPLPDGPFEISLDHRVLRSPAKKPLRFSNPALAHAIAAEWEWQDSSGVRSYTMPLMKLASIAIDQVPNDKERIITTLLKYCHTDALCCRASPESVLYVSGCDEEKAGLTVARAPEFLKSCQRWHSDAYHRKRLSEPTRCLFTLMRSEALVSCRVKDRRYLFVLRCGLSDKQARHWDPLLDWVETEIGARPVVSSSIFGPNQPQEVVSSLEKNLRGLNHWQLAAIDSLAGSARSIVVALAIARNKLNIEEAIEIIRLEENHQVEDWGYVEGGHDIDEADIRVRIAAASVFLRLL